MNPDELLELAQELATREVGNPRQTSLKRALSTAYYALFHAVARECVACLIGWNFRSPDYWRVVSPIYRAFDHKTAKDLFRRLARDQTSPAELQQVGLAFVDLQEARISADYDPGSRFARGRVLQMVEQARTAIHLLQGLSPETRRLLVVQLITKQR